MLLSIWPCFVGVTSLICWFRCSNAEYNFTTRYADVHLDHFSFTTNKTFKLKYLVNDAYWSKGQPIFFYTGNEGPIETFAQNTGFMISLAEKLRAMVVFAEHRFYGETQPFGKIVYHNSTEHLGYLSSQQALADYVELIDQLRKHCGSNDDVPVIAFGGSYGGMLAAWLRMRYPASVQGAIASSAPILQFSGLTPCESFNTIVTAVFRYTKDNQDCSELIGESWGRIRNVSAQPDGRKWLSNQFHLCQPLNTTNDVDEFVDWMSNIFASLAMVNYPYATSFLAPLPANPVNAFCETLIAEQEHNDTGTSNVDKLLVSLSKAVQLYTNYTKNNTCNQLGHTSKNVDDLMWGFQACTEMIMPMCSTDNDMFETRAWNASAYQDDCFRRYGVRQPNVDLVVQQYGGKDLSAASNIVFSNGLLDPWSSGGVFYNASPTVVPYVIPEAAHHLDLRASNQHDPKSVIRARHFHESMINKWLDQFYPDQFGKRNQA